MKFEFLPAKDDPGYWDVYNTDTGEKLDWCASPSMAVYAVLKALRAHDDAVDDTEDDTEEETA